MSRPIESARTGTTINVRFDDGTVIDLQCPAALIGNPMARLIVELDYIAAHTTGDLRPQWQAPDAEDLADDLRHVMEQMPESTWRGLNVKPGWYPLVVETHRELLEVAPDYELIQVDQSKARLRVWLWHDDEGVLAQLRTVTHAAAERSTGICEYCGDEALPKAVGPGWFMRLCGPCAGFRAAWNRVWEGKR